MSVDAYTPEDSKQDLDSRLKAFWDLESLGIKADECSVYQEFEKTIKFKGSRYEVSLPWKQFRLELPDHYDLSLKRLIGLLKRLRETPEVRTSSVRCHHTGPNQERDSRVRGY